jgi:hypothetical protein
MPVIQGSIGGPLPLGFRNRWISGVVRPMLKKGGTYVLSGSARSSFY